MFKRIAQVVCKSKYLIVKWGAFASLLRFFKCHDTAVKKNRRSR